MASDNISEVTNGNVECSGSTCELECEDNYHSYGGPAKVKCKQHTSSRGVTWTKNIGECKTCKDPHFDDIDTSIFKVCRNFLE